jgi:SEC-C motif
MTYCIGFKKESTVCLVADSAVTGPQPDRSHTSFGELQVTAHQGISERVLKIFRFPEAALTFPGNMALVQHFVEQFATRTGTGVPVAQAFEESAATLTPLRVPSDLQAIFAYCSPSCGRLLSFNAAHDQRVSEHQDLVQIGAADPGRRQLTVEALETLSKINLNPIQTMVALVAYCQSHAVHQYLLPTGIGGGFCGISTDTASVRWQPDVAYQFYRPEYFNRVPGLPPLETVLACVHEDVFVLRSSVVSKSVRAMTNSRLGESPAAAQVRADAAIRYSKDVVLQRGAAYLAFLCTAFPTTALCDVRGHPVHKNIIQLPAIEANGAISVNVVIYEELARILRDPPQGRPRFLFVQFDPIHPPVEANATCPCGSGREYINCHGLRGPV